MHLKESIVHGLLIFHSFLKPPSVDGCDSICRRTLSIRCLSSSMDYRAGVLSGRPIFWCPDGEGHLPFCPAPTDPDENVYCCQYFYLGETFPTCCRFPIHAGLVIALIICAPIVFLLAIFLYCWFWPGSPLNIRRRHLQQQSQPNPRGAFSER